MATVYSDVFLPVQGLIGLHSWGAAYHTLHRPPPCGALAEGVRCAAASCPLRHCSVSIADTAAGTLNLVIFDQPVLLLATVSVLSLSLCLPLSGACIGLGVQRPGNSGRGPYSLHFPGPLGHLWCTTVGQGFCRPAISYQDSMPPSRKRLRRPPPTGCGSEHETESSEGRVPTRAAPKAKARAKQRTAKAKPKAKQAAKTRPERKAKAKARPPPESSSETSTPDPAAARTRRAARAAPSSSETQPQAPLARRLTTSGYSAIFGNNGGAVEAEDPRAAASGQPPCRGCGHGQPGGAR